MGIQDLFELARSLGPSGIFVAFIGAIVLLLILRLLSRVRT